MITAPILTWIHDHLEDDGYSVYEKNDSGDWELWEMKEGDWEECDWDLIEAKSENLSNNVAIPDMEPKGIYIHQHRVSSFILFFVLILFSFDTNGIQQIPPEGLGFSPSNFESSLCPETTECFVHKLLRFVKDDSS